MSVDAGSVEVVSEREMAGAFSSWAERRKGDDDFESSIEFLTRLQQAIDDGKATRIGFSVIDSEVDPKTVENLTGLLRVVDYNPVMPQIGAIIIGKDTVIDVGTKIAGSPIIIDSQLLSAPIVGFDNKNTVVRGRSVVVNSTVSGSEIDSSTVETSRIFFSRVANGSNLNVCKIRNSTLVDARFTNVDGSTGDREIGGDMQAINLSYSGVGSLKVVHTTPMAKQD